MSAVSSTTVSTFSMTESKMPLNGLARCTQLMVTNLRLIMDFSRRAVEIQGAEAKILAVNDAVTEDNRIDQRNRRFGPMLMSLIVATYVVAGDLMLLHENMSIGQFLTNMEVFRRVCDA